MVGISPSFSSSQKKRGDGKQVKMGHFAFGAFFLVGYMLALYVWAGVFLNNMDFSDRYTRLLPFAGSSFRHTARYGWEWGFIYAMFFINLLPGYLLACAICNNSHPRWSKIHYWISEIAVVGNFVFFIALGVMWLFVCNTGHSQGSPCNSAQWCCSHYVDKPEWCQNGIACAGDVDNSRNTEFFATFMYSWIFFVLAFFHIKVNKDLRSVGMFMEEEEEEKEEEIDDEEEKELKN